MLDAYYLQNRMDERSRDLQEAITASRREADASRIASEAAPPVISGRALLMRNMRRMRRMQFSRHAVRVGRLVISW